MEKQPSIFAPQEKLIGMAVVIIPALVNLAGGETVAEHLRHISSRHLHAADAAAVPLVIRPIFKVVPVAALVVEPCGAVAKLFSLGVVRAVIPLEVTDACPELHWGVFGQVVGQALPVQPQAEAIFPHQGAVAVDGFQMAPKVQNDHLVLSEGEYSTKRRKKRDIFAWNSIGGKN